MKTTIKKCLFGGALLGAGICSSATAGTFIWGAGSNNFTGEQTGAYNYFTTTGGWDASSSTGDSYSATTGNDFGLSMVAYAGNTDLAFAFILVPMPFQVSDTMTVNIEWDFGGDGDNPFTDSFITIADNIGNIFTANLADPTGSTTLNLVAGINYTFKGLTLASPSGFSSFSMSTDVNVVPLPPAAFAGLGMLAGLGAYRRIRK